MNRIKLFFLLGFFFTNNARSMDEVPKNAIDFIILAKTDAPLSLTMAQKYGQGILSHFTNFSDFYCLAKANSSVAYKLAENHGEMIVSLFKQFSEFVELATIDKNTSYHLAKVHGEAVLSLPFQASEFIDFKKNHKNSASMLINENSYPIAIIFVKNPKDFDNLQKIDEELSELLFLLQSNLLNSIMQYWQHFPSLSLFHIGILNRDNKKGPSLLPEIVSHIDIFILRLYMNSQLFF